MPLTVPYLASAKIVKVWSLYSWAVVKALTLLKAFSEATEAGRGRDASFLLGRYGGLGFPLA